jgi:predicted metalloprotease with PDZ domain
VRFPRTSGLLVSAIFCACGSHGAREGSSPDAGIDANGSAREAPWTGLELDLTPDPVKHELRVVLHLTGDAVAGVRELSLSRGWAGARAIDCVGPLEVRDALGELPLGPARDEGEDRRFSLGRAASGGELWVRYWARADTGRSRFGLHVEADRMSGVGHTFLALPRLATPVPVELRVHLEALPKGTAAASSFGVGRELRTRASSEELAHALYVAGPLVVEEARAEAGTEARALGSRLAVLGAPVFDSRAAYYWTTAAFGQIAGYFGEESAAREPFQILLVPTRGLGGDHDGAYLHHSFGLWFDAARAFDAGLKSVVAHELTHRFVGGGVHLEDAQGREVTWFSEGFTVHLARRLLVESGLVTPRDVLADLERTTGDEPDTGAARACAEEERGRSQAEYRQGARYAAVVDAALRERSKGERGLPDLVRELLQRAKREKRAAFPVAVWRELVVRELGERAGEELDQKVLGGAPITLPDGVFGPCFAKAWTEARVFELGFDRAGIDGSMGMVRGLVRGSAAEKAGLRDGMLIVAARVPDARPIPADDAAVPEVELTLAGAGRGKTVRYRPIGKRRVERWDARPCSLRR